MHTRAPQLDLQHGRHAPPHSTAGLWRAVRSPSVPLRTCRWVPVCVCGHVPTVVFSPVRRHRFVRDYYPETPRRVCPFVWHYPRPSAAWTALGPHRRRSPRSKSGVAGRLCQRHSYSRIPVQCIARRSSTLPGPAQMPSRLAKPGCTRARVNTCAYHPTHSALRTAHSARETTEVSRGPRVPCAHVRPAIVPVVPPHTVVISPAAPVVVLSVNRDTAVGQLPVTT